MAKDLVKAGDDSSAMVEMTPDQVELAIANAAKKNPQLGVLRDKLIAAIEKSDGGMENFVRLLRSKLHEE